MKFLSSFSIIIFSIFQIAHAQVHIDAETINSGKSIYFSGWKYHPGDNPAWADPNFDDSDWETVDSRLTEDNLPDSGWNNIGWFRIHINLDDGLIGKPLALLLSQWGASEIYLHGEKRFSFGSVSSNPDQEKAYVLPFHRNPRGRSRIPHAEFIELEHGSSYVIAVRYSNHHVKHVKHVFHLFNTLGFEIGLQDYFSWSGDRKGFEQYTQLNYIAFPFVVLLMIIFNLSLYLCLPKKYEYLYFTFFLLFSLLSIFLGFHIFYSNNIYVWIISIYLSHTAFRLMFLFFLLFVYTVFSIKIPFYYWIIVVYGVYSLIFYTGYAFDSLLQLLIMIELFRVLIITRLEQKTGLWLLRTSLIGYSIVVLITATPLFISSFSTTSYHSNYLYLFGIYFILMTTSIYLAIQYANTFKEIGKLNVELEGQVQRRTSAWEKANMELQEANEHLQELDKMKSSFVSQASHDLRTPLTSIKSSLDNLVRGVGGGLSDRQGQVVGRALNSVNRLTALINDVLDINRIESGRMTLDKSLVQMESIVKNILQENKPFANAKKIKINASGLDQSYPLEVDGGKIERVVNELVNNAIKYTPESGAIDVSLTQTDSQFQFSVKDNGIGMTKEDCTKIFERFYRVDAAKMQAKGSGLGLSIAKELVEMHGGSIQVNSQLHQGTQFTLTLPINNRSNS